MISNILDILYSIFTKLSFVFLAIMCVLSFYQQYKISQYEQELDAIKIANSVLQSTVDKYKLDLETTKSNVDKANKEIEDKTNKTLEDVDKSLKLDDSAENQICVTRSLLDEFSKNK